MSSFRKVKDSLADAALNEILLRGAPILGTFSELTGMISNTISLDPFYLDSGVILTIAFRHSGPLFENNQNK